jgi:cyclopropane fatty-acyl-phospholipid synthase-like methyltransferase
MTFAKFDASGNLMVNMERWGSITTEPEKWKARYRALAQHIKNGSTVLEFGCGGMCLKAVLPLSASISPATSSSAQTTA